LKVKELQTFEIKTILCLFNVFTSTSKKMVLDELCNILSKAQAMAQEYDAMTICTYVRKADDHIL
jgi:hypothetical protein